MTITYLNERSVYEERYDRWTVEQCRWYEERALRINQDEDVPEEVKQRPGLRRWLIHYMIFHETGERYLDREKTINEWMEGDRQRDAMLARARPPLIRCPSCNRAMDCMHTHLSYGIEANERDRVAFYLGCKPCKQSKHVYEDGTEIIRKPSVCKKCEEEVECTTQKEDDKEYYVDTCKQCGHIEKTLKLPDEDEAPTEEEIARFQRDKVRFCISKDQGARFLYWKENVKRLDAKKEEIVVNADLYDKLKDMKKLNIAALEELLKEAVKKVGYDDLLISLPATEREIVLHFTLRDLKADRAERESQKTLEKTIEEILDDTNWSLMSDGVHYRLGLLNGRLKGHEIQPELEALAKSRMKKKPKKKN